MALLTLAVSSLIVLLPALYPSLLLPTRTTLPRPRPRAAPISLNLSATLPPLGPLPSPTPSPTPPAPSPRSSAPPLPSPSSSPTPSGPSPPPSSPPALPSANQHLLLQRGLFAAAGPLFFARLRDRPTGYLNTPLTVVAAGLAKWLDIYSGVLTVRVLLSRFPNIPWERQPLSAIRDLCDPYLNLFRNIIPPIFDTLDVSPLLAFVVLGCLGAILNGTRASN